MRAPLNWITGLRPAAAPPLQHFRKIDKADPLLFEPGDHPLEHSEGSLAHMADGDDLSLLPRQRRRLFELPLDKALLVLGVKKDLVGPARSPNSRATCRATLCDEVRLSTKSLSCRFSSAITTFMRARLVVTLEP